MVRVFITRLSRHVNGCTVFLINSARRFDDRFTPGRHTPENLRRRCVGLLKFCLARCLDKSKGISVVPSRPFPALPLRLGAPPRADRLHRNLFSNASYACFSITILTPYEYPRHGNQIKLQR